MTELKTINGGQKDALLRRANIKKTSKDCINYTLILNMLNMSNQHYSVRLFLCYLIDITCERLQGKSIYVASVN